MQARTATRFFSSLTAAFLFTGASRAQSLPTPTHILDAEALVSQIQAANNSYGTDDRGITWEGTVSNRSVCATFATLLFGHSYGLDGAFMKLLTGSTSPFAATYYDAIAHEAMAYSPTLGAWEYQNITKISDVVVGDQIAIKYLAACTGGSASTVTGHVAFVDAMPQYVGVSADGAIYDVVVIDSSSSTHGSKDTRVTRPDADGTADDGLGRGTMRMFVNADGIVTAYKWSPASSATCYASQRPLVFGRLSRL